MRNPTGTVVFFSAMAVACASLLVISLSRALADPDRAQAWTTQNYNWVYESTSLDAFMNYDGGNPGYSTNVDWPIRYFFYGGAHVDKIKNRIDGCGNDPSLTPQLCNSGGGVNLKFIDSYPTIQYDSDDGKKRSISCANPWDYHTRIYAPNPDASSVDFGYNSNWGMWVVASVHRDYEVVWNDLPASCSSNYQSLESDEDWFNQRIATMNSLLPLNDRWSSFYTNSYYFGNPELYHQGDATHLVESNGYATGARVP